METIRSALRDFGDAQEVDFVEPHWKCLSRLSVPLFQVGVALFCLYFESESLRMHGTSHLVFLSDQAFLLLTVYAVYNAALTLMWHWAHRGKLRQKITYHVEVDKELAEGNGDGPEREETPLPLRFRVSWLLFELVYGLAATVTVIFFTMMSTLSSNTSTHVLATHMFNFVIVIADFMLTARPARVMRQAWPSLLYGFFYFIFSVMHWLSSEENPVNGKPFLYSVLPYGRDWKMCGFTLLAATTVLALAQFLKYILYRFKMFLSGRYIF